MSNINNHNEEEEIRGLLDQIRQQGTPYSEEPDPLYWANFRVRVMERVAEPERISIFAKAKSWLWGSGLRTGLVGGGLAVLLLGGVYFGTQNRTDVIDMPGQVAQSQQSQQQTQQTGQQPAVKPVDTVAGQQEEIMELETRPMPQIDGQQMAQAPEATPHLTEQPNATQQMTEPEAAAPVLAANVGLEGPATSLDDMTEAELKALLADVEAMN